MKNTFQLTLNSLFVLKIFKILFFQEFLTIFSKTIYANLAVFSWFVFQQVELILNKCLKSSFYDILFFPSFLSVKLLLMPHILSLFIHLIDFKLNQLLIYFNLSLMVRLNYNLKHQILFQHLLQCLRKCLLLLCRL